MAVTYVIVRFLRRKLSLVIIVLAIVGVWSFLKRSSFLTPYYVRQVDQSKGNFTTTTAPHRDREAASGSHSTAPHRDREVANGSHSNNRANASESIRRRRITVELAGCARLGNLMFGHASMLGLADRLRLDPIVSSTNKLLLSSFDLGIPSEQRAASGWNRCEERMASGYDSNIIELIRNSSAGGVLLLGYFQSWRYFDHIRDRIVREFRFKRPTAERAAGIIASMTEKHSQRIKTVANDSTRTDIVRVGIHVRRGDMAITSSLQKGYTVASPEYLKRAMAYMEQRLVNGSVSLLYIVVSDDISWCRSQITSQKFPVEFLSNDASIDLAVLASCHHTIISVGTYGWWAAYLAGGITVYYKDYPKNGSEISEGFRSQDYFHPTWVGFS